MPAESKARPGWVGWWVISGDLPTDYVSADTIKHPRDAMRAISERWAEVSGYMLRGEAHPIMKIGAPEEWPMLGDLLKRRADMLAEIVADDNAWVGYGADS